MSQTIAARVILILAQQALRRPESLTTDMGLVDLGLDSLGVVEVLFALESAFDLTIPVDSEGPASFADLTIGELADLIERLQGDITR